MTRLKLYFALIWISLCITACGIGIEARTNTEKEVVTFDELDQGGIMVINDEIIELK